jgi:hypothetical protein
MRCRARAQAPPATVALPLRARRAQARRSQHRPLALPRRRRRAGRPQAAVARRAAPAAHRRAHRHLHAACARSGPRPPRCAHGTASHPPACPPERTSRALRAGNAVRKHPGKGDRRARADCARMRVPASARRTRKRRCTARLADMRARSGGAVRKSRRPVWPDGRFSWPWPVLAGSTDGPQRSSVQGCTRAGDSWHAAKSQPPRGRTA